MLQRSTWISAYGPALITHSGKGQVEFANGRAEFCDFEAGQLADGRPLVECHFASFDLFPFPDAPIALSGTLDDGRPIRAELGIEVPYLPDLPRGALGVFAVFACREIKVGADDGTTAAVRYALTNFLFEGAPDSRSLQIPLSQSDGRFAEATIIPRTAYSRTEQELRTLKAIAVTCDVVIRTGGKLTTSDIRVFIDDLCYVLSVARGTKILWVSEVLEAADGAELHASYCDRITKRYTPLRIIDRAHQETRRFIEVAFPRYVTMRDSYRLPRGTIDTWLDARAEGDYLEVRGIKASVAVEVLKDVFLQQRSTHEGEFIVLDETFRRLQKAIKQAVGDVLRSGEVLPTQRAEIYNNVGALNRTSFNTVLRAMLATLDLPVSDGDLKLLIESRNELIHTGRFYVDGADARQRKQVPPLPSKIEEFFHLVSFTDRCFLRLLGYDGPWIDWRKPAAPEHRSTVR